MKKRPVKILCLAGLLTLANDRALGAPTNANLILIYATNAAVKAAPSAATNTPPVVQPPKPHPDTLIEADGPADFDLTGRRMIQRDHVRVDAPEMKMRCEWLAADLPQEGGRVTNIVAETNVVIDFTDEKGKPYHATGDKAVYSYQVQGGVTNETITLTGNPAQIDEATVTSFGDEIIYYRINNRVSIPRNPRMISRQKLNGATAGTNVNEAIAATNSPPAAPDLSLTNTNTLVEPAK